MEFKLNLVALLISLNSIIYFVNAADSVWTYESQARWNETQNIICGNAFQSPIDIDEKDVIKNIFPSFKLTGWESHECKMHVEHNGHSIKISVCHDHFSSGGGLNGEYKLDHVHFHWGNATQAGSEHYISGKQYSAEMHFVHHNKMYANVGESADKVNGLAVLGVFLVVGKEDNPAFTNIEKEIKNLQYTGDKVDINEFSFENLLPKNKNDIYRYQGSLTTPPCYETVTWTLFTEPIEISKAQLDSLYTMYDGKNETGVSPKPLLNTFRDPQPILGRPIYHATLLDNEDFEKASDPNSNQNCTLNSNINSNSNSNSSPIIGCSLILLFSIISGHFF